MKKLILAALVTIAVFVSAIYFFIPSPIRISNSVSFNSSLDGTLRALRNNQNWKKLTQGTVQAAKPLLNGLNIVADSGSSHPTRGKIMLVAMRNDSTVILWELEMQKSNGPWGRIKDYFHAVNIKENMDDAIHKFRLMCEDTKQLYGIQIIPKSTVDTLIMATKFVVDHYPHYDEIYRRIDTIKQYIKSRDALVSGYPMLNITKYDSIYKVMVAIPVNRILDDHEKLFFVRMVPGRFLTAEIKGGPNTIKQANDMMSLYFAEYQRTTMAIPYEYMVTDRMQEKDTSKWITRIYAPVF